MIDSRRIEQLKMEARMLHVMGDWRGLMVVLDDLEPLLKQQPTRGAEFWRELAAFEVLRKQLMALLS